MATSVLEHLASKIREDAEYQKEGMAKGGCKDYADYRHTAGVIRGLQKAERIVIELHKSIERGEDEDE